MKKFDIIVKNTKLYGVISMGVNNSHTISTTVSADFLDNFHLLLDNQNEKNSLKFYCPQIDANSFNYDNLTLSLCDAAAHYCLSRRTWEEYKNKPMLLSKIVREKFRKLSSNDGELGELMLFSFLETDLNAPKIATKMELKTNPNMYFNGADGVHFLKVSESNYQLIFGESKVYQNLMDGISAAVSSIQKFKTNSIKDDQSGETRGITFERGLINAHLLQETFSEEDRSFVKSLIYPRANNPYFVDTAFAVFVLFDVEIPAKKKELGNIEFREWIFNELKTTIQGNLSNIFSKISTHNLNGHPFYFYLVPFENLSSAQNTVLEGVLK